MIEHSIVFIGLDTHKEFIEIAYIEDQRAERHLLISDVYQALRWLTLSVAK